ncbi:hypothetical protein QJS04_geneDACA012438 [Acorus gramineus]|uniref:U1-type domain-containing protein n=1 Tax=Acorus gramineus TaxID=55184 RepID=A0AAV9BAZ0_ACOGR|nr:hypothetical protein QJS04_geneDACA012438 [Acorus gramineus]
MGRGGGRRFPQSHPEVPSPYPAAEPSHAPAQTHPSIPPMPIRQPPVVARCDICKVDCNSLEILDQHKNGKRHKKNLQRFEEIQKHQRLIVESQARYAPISAITAAPIPTVNSATPTTMSAATNAAITSSNEQQPPSEPPVAQAGVGENEENCALPIADNLPAAVAADENNLPNQQETVAVPAQLEPIQADLSENLPPQQRQKNSIRPPRNDGYDRKSFPMKRQMMMMVGRGGKRFRGPMGASRPMPPERPREPHRICTLCNVLCESLQVFESHLAGKKHASNVKRYEGQGLVYGQMSHYLPPNQLPPAYVPHASHQQPIFYGLQNQEMTQQVYVPQLGVSEPQAQQDHGQTQEGILGAQSQQDQTKTQLEGTLPEDSAAEVNMVLENTETKPDDVSKTEDLVHASSNEPAVTESNIKVEGPVTNVEMPASDMVSATENKLAFTGTIASLEHNTELEVPASDMVLVPEYGLDQMWDIVLPGLEPKVEEPATNAETAALHVDEYALDLKEPDLVTEVVDQDTSLI